MIIATHIKRRFNDYYLNYTAHQLAVEKVLALIDKVNTNQKMPARQLDYIEELRRVLYELLNCEQDTGDIVKISHRFLVYLAYKRPLNAKDVFTLVPIAEIEKQDRFVFATGHHCSLQALATWVKKVGDYISPLDNLMFFPQDILRFKAMCHKRGLQYKKQAKHLITAEHMVTSQELLEQLEVPRISQQHNSALAKLITKPTIDLSRESAIAELRGLQPRQAQVLEALYEHGLKGRDLRAWQGGRFSKRHVRVLKELIIRQGMRPSVAVEKISGLSGAAAQRLLLTTTIYPEPKSILRSKDKPQAQSRYSFFKKITPIAATAAVLGASAIYIYNAN